MDKELKAISPLDGRYFEKVKELESYFSEYALQKYRLYVELRYLIALGKGKKKLMQLYEDFSITDAVRIKEIEKKTNHDVKAVEYFIRENVGDDVKPYIHYGLTSEDINNLAYSLLLQHFLNDIFHEKHQTLLTALHSLSVQYKGLPMLSRTHGQPASPTTLGKEFLVFYARLYEQVAELKKIQLRGKLNGASGNLNGLAIAEPGRDWLAFAQSFVEGLGLIYNPVTTQIEPKDTLITLFQNCKRINSILIDLCRDVWLYISYGYFILKKKKGEVGSSTMPHKINPIDFENAEGNLKLANALFSLFECLAISRMQRDLSDSTVMRNIGVAFGHTCLACASLEKGLNKLVPNKETLAQDLEEHPEVLTEAIQTILRKHGQQQSYERLKNFSRGKKVTIGMLREFIDELPLSEKEKKHLKGLQAKDYVGLAESIVDKYKEVK